MKKIILIQSRVTPERIVREENNFRRAAGDSAELSCLSSLDESLAWTLPDAFLKGYDGLIFGGSSDFDFHGGRQSDDPVRLTSQKILARTTDLVSHAFTQHVPVLGVCYGHQLIANMYGGDVHNDKSQNKFGKYEVHLTDLGTQDVLFQNLPHSFAAQYAHKDSVSKLPDGATLMATGASCRFAALRYGQKAYTTQFHPEIQSFRKADRPEQESPEASKIVALWIEKVLINE